MADAKEVYVLVGGCPRGYLSWGTCPGVVVWG